MKTIMTYLIAVFGVIFLMTAWVLIQKIWKKVFEEHVSDDDALAQRTRCTNCGCTTVCKNKTHHTTSNIH